MTDEQLIEQAIRDYIEEHAPFYAATMESYIPGLAEHIAKVLKADHAA